MESNELKNSLNQMMSGLNGMVKALDSNLANIKSSMTTEQAKEFAKAMNTANPNDMLKDFEDLNKKLKKEFNI